MRPGWIAVVLLSTGVASAGPGMSPPRGAGGFQLSLAYEKVAEPSHTERLSHVVSAGISARGVLGRTVGLAAVIDVRVGFGVPGAFVYEADLLPAGVGVRFGRSASLSLVAGVGVSAAYERIPRSAQLPVEVHLESDLGRHLRVALFARAAFVTDGARKDGSPSIGFVDELTTGLGLRFGKRFDLSGAALGRGTLVGVTYREQMGTRLFGVVLAFAFSAAN